MRLSYFIPSKMLLCYNKNSICIVFMRYIMFKLYLFLKILSLYLLFRWINLFDSLSQCQYVTIKNYFIWSSLHSQYKIRTMLRLSVQFQWYPIILRLFYIINWQGILYLNIFFHAFKLFYSLEKCYYVTMKIHFVTFLCRTDCLNYTSLWKYYDVCLFSLACN